MAVFSLPVPLSSSAAVPLAVFSVPMVLNKSAAAPVAVFESPVLRSSAPAPTAVLKLPVGDAKQAKTYQLLCSQRLEVRALKGVVPPQQW